jgi:hypothetical protein
MPGSCLQLPLLLPWPPGTAGTERAFNSRYGRAVAAAKYSKRGSREADAGVLAVDALHKQVGGGGRGARTTTTTTTTTWGVCA